MLFITIYQPPNSDENSFINVFDKVQDTIDAHLTTSPEIIIFWDFNFPHINWETSKVQGDVGASQARRLLELLNHNNLTQHIPSKHFNNGPMMASIGNPDLSVLVLRRKVHLPVSGRCSKVIRMHRGRQRPDSFSISARLHT